VTLDPIKPYLPIVALILGVLLLFGGCHWGKAIEGNKTAEAKAESLKWAEAAAGYKQASEGWKARYEADQKEAARQREAARKELAGIERDRKAAEKEAADWRARFTKAQRNPDCAELMRSTSCPAFTDY
jgi:hypothetical protein